MEEVISKLTTLREAVAAFNNLKKNPTIVRVSKEVVLVNEFLGDVVQLNFDMCSIGVPR